MTINPIEENSTPTPTGSLEDLFRYHLGEKAAVPPRPLLWDQIDTSLLVRQNETYRRRLAATRWVAAASLALASLAGTGWWAQHAADMAGPEVATRATGAAPSAAGGSVAAGDDVPNGSAPGQAAINAVAANNSPAPGNYVAETDARTTRQQTGWGAAAVRSALAPGLTNAGSGSQSSRAGTAETAAALTSGQTTTRLNGSGNATGLVFIAAETAGATAAAALPQASSSVAPFEPVGWLAANPAALALGSPAALPNGLATLPTDEEPAAPARKWHYGATYTVGAFNPNIDFSRTGIGPAYGYNPALGADSPALTEAAAAQYRENLRPGLSQRLALVARRQLAGHWSLSTGAEFAQATAQSASTSAFVGEQLLDLGQFSTGALRTTDFRYRTAGLPVEVSYGNAAKRGWSLYGRLGGVVSALLGVRSAVEGSPEATRTYSVASAGTPYRRVLGSVRAAAGTQFRPAAGNWALTLGPVAELGLVPLNAHPAQSYLAQSRPHTFGVEAGVEFGK